MRGNQLHCLFIIPLLFMDQFSMDLERKKHRENRTYTAKRNPGVIWKKFINVNNDWRLISSYCDINVRKWHMREVPVSVKECKLSKKKTGQRRKVERKTKDFLVYFLYFSPFLFYYCFEFSFFVFVSPLHYLLSLSLSRLF